ncbi:hypothetical protein MAPG_09435 [Magnaporthiopsis poae ATCC 64411]|uniref:Uncharacterized protein n=1 Tax=Magnaporthiopsis poae (strain ATCC 64411 / 73-15) TaxID=644358 RepID=A0A0C4E9Y3_MAGP6|nr:hypothetical protein MAPG_09435 [Magnaporthiopsis poae ATCC 64411]
MTTNMGKQLQQQEPIAIVGLACRLPGGSSSPEKLWDFLERGGIASRDVPATRFRVDTHYDGSLKPGTMRPPGGMFLSDVDPAHFDASFFEVSGADAATMDPNQRQMLEVVFEGLESAGLTLERLDGRTVACFVGSYANDYADMQNRDPLDRAGNYTVGVGRASMANRLSYFLNVKGQSVTLDAACAGSMVGIHMGARALHNGECEAAIIASSNLFINPDHVQDVGGLSTAHSPSGLCHVFDADADGYIKAEAVSAVIIKRLADAVRDGDPIRAVIRGTASTHNGRTNGIASPSSEAQAAGIRQAYASAGIDNFNDTAYLECHGTGTPAGDPTEVNGAASVFAPSRDPAKPLIIGSIKSNIGHSEPAAGNSGIIKAVLSMEKGRIPGTATFIKPSPMIDFAANRVRASRTTIAWPDEPGKIRRASVNSFGYGGTNAHVVVEQAPPELPVRHVSSYAPPGEDDLSFDDGDDVDGEAARRPHTLVLSANDEASLRAKIDALCAHLMDPRVRVKLPDLAYTLSERRSRFWYRAFATAASATDIHPGDFTLGKKKPKTPRVGFVFTGQGAQWPQMGKAVLELFPDAARATARTALTDINDRRGEVITGRNHSIPIDQRLDPAPGCYAWPDSKSHMLAENSPASVTISGRKKALEALADDVKAAGHFARLLQVDLAYHSNLMGTIGEEYESLLAQDGDGRFGSDTSAAAGSGVTMFSSVTASSRSEPTDGAYWKANMVSPVRFDEALAAMVSDPQSQPTILIEIGPSGALAGPVSQVLKSLPVAADVAYVSSYSRGPDAAKSLLGLAGRLFNAGAHVDLARANGVPPQGAATATDLPRVIVDLPKYAWNHSIRYWFENQSSRDWRFKPFKTHDLIGGKVLGSPWQAPSFRKRISLDDVPWLGDHKMGPDVLMPAAGYMAMALEAMYQTHCMVKPERAVDSPSRLAYRFRNVRFERALVFEQHKPVPVVLSLAPVPGSGAAGWYQFHVSSEVEGGAVLQHCHGSVQVVQEEEAVGQTLSGPSLAPLQHHTSSKLWYKAQDEVGMHFGPAFQKVLEIESASGQPRCRTRISMEPPKSRWDPQSHYPIHPAVLDACLQSANPALADGERCRTKDILIPSVLDEVLINRQPNKVLPAQGLAVAEAVFSGRGRRDEAKSYFANVGVHDPDSGELLMRARGIHVTKLDAGIRGPSHTFNRLCWKPDISLLTEDQLAHLTLTAADDQTASKLDVVIDLVAHRKANLKVLEVDLVGGEGASSAWFQAAADSSASLRAAYSRYDFASTDANSLVEIQARYGSHGRTSFFLANAAASGALGLTVDVQYDLVLVKSPYGAAAPLAPEDLVRRLKPLMAPGAFVVLVACDDKTPTSVKEDLSKILDAAAGSGHEHDDIPTPSSSSDSGSPHVASPGNFSPGNSPEDSSSEMENAPSDTDDAPSTAWNRQTLRRLGKAGGGHFDAVLGVHVAAAERQTVFVGRIKANGASETTAPGGLRNLAVLRFQNSTPDLTQPLRDMLETSGWKVTHHTHRDVTQLLSQQQASSSTAVLVLDELVSPLLATVDGQQWESIKALASSGTPMLWVTKGTQFERVTDPDRALVYGLFRTVRREDPSARLTVLDVESGAASATTAWAIDKMLQVMRAGGGGGQRTTSEEAAAAEFEFGRRRAVWSSFRAAATTMPPAAVATAVLAKARTTRSGPAQAFRMMVQQAAAAAESAAASSPALINAAVGLLSAQVTKLLRLETAVEPGKPLAAYGLDSLSAVDIRGWARRRAGAELSTLDIVNAASLYALAEKMVVRAVAGAAAAAAAA